MASFWTWTRPESRMLLQDQAIFSRDLVNYCEPRDKHLIPHLKKMQLDLDKLFLRWIDGIQMRNAYKSMLAPSGLIFSLGNILL
ncbi:hypothetical protein L1987_64086 [Smallanthus sonchifolius]|uniref:Uncharacterized protein n=1 Tax=Smallanthus sonchifolius TaxID=185202 RepID=A0ACB9CFC8_9ASTR|nr:hypothetical protein L1987_64086 [Smallanthus sonchifolius]